MMQTEKTVLRSQAGGEIRPHATGKPIVAQADQALTLRESHGEPRVDSRLLAAHMSNTHKHVRELIEDYRKHFERFGVLRFETAKPHQGASGGRPERFAMLNEDQCYFLLTLIRNTDHVVDLKACLVLAFRDARANQVLRKEAYLPTYHALHDEVMALAQVAHAAGSETPEATFHMNINKLVNKVAGIEPGSRGTMTESKRLFVMNLQAVVRNALHAAIEAGENHKAAYQRAKSAAVEWAGTARRLMGVA